MLPVETVDGGAVADRRLVAAGREQFDEFAQAPGPPVKDFDRVLKFSFDYNRK
jgi:hypothetical protein